MMVDSRSDVRRYNASGAGSLLRHYRQLGPALWFAKPFRFDEGLRYTTG